MSSPACPSQSPSSGQAQNPTLDRSQSAPAAMEQAPVPGQCQARPGLQELPTPLSLAKDEASAPHPLPLHSNSKVPPIASSSTDVVRTCTPPADVTAMSQDPGGEAQPGVTGEVVNGSEEASHIQPMEQEEADTTAVCPSAPSQPGSVEMESPAAAASSERDQPDGDRCSSSDSIPSLAAALMELHELLVSNNRAQSQNRSSSCSPSHPFNQDSDRVSPEPRPPTPDDAQPAPSTAITAVAGDSDAKANHAAAASDEEPSQYLVRSVSDQNELLGGDAAETGERKGPPPCPDSSMDTRPDQCGQGEASDVSTSQSEPDVPTGPAADPESREPPEGQHSRGVADGQASGSNTEDSLQTERTFLNPVSTAAGSREDVSITLSSSLSQAPQPSSPAPLPPPPHPFIEQFPAEHIQRIQAAGFSAREAVEALERAHGVVELALLALLARSITVPT